MSDERWEALERENDSLQRENARLTRRVDELRPLAALGVRNADLEQQLAPLCPCKHNGANMDAEQECPVHGDGETFVAYVRALEDVNRAARAHLAEKWPPKYKEWVSFRQALDSAAVDGAG